MGYTGRIVVARSARPLAELTALTDAKVLHESAYRDGWRSAQLDGDAPGALAGLLAETSAPVLWAYVLDSDLADVEATTAGGTAWHTYLHQDLARSYGAPPLDQPADEVLRLALAWAAEAGLVPDPQAVRTALAADHDFAEETLAELLEALGLSAVPAE